jgi:uncharacterized membrane protein
MIVLPLLYFFFAINFNFSFCKPCLSLNFDAKCGNHGGVIKLLFIELSTVVVVVVDTGNDETIVGVVVSFVVGGGGNIYRCIIICIYIWCWK